MEVWAYLPSTGDFPAGDPFYVEHGHGLVKDEDLPRGLFDFVLYVDGAVQKPDYRSTNVETNLWLGPPDNLVFYPWLMFRTNVYNYADGMTGTHVFTGQWTAPCQWAVDHGYYAGACATQNQVVVMSSVTRTIEFTE